MALRNEAAEYFGNLNSIASRIYADLQETKGAYEDLWTQLSQQEQDQILTESIIKPEICVKYTARATKENDEYASKIVVDDHCSYRDEHSGPFSFRTKSQRNLTVFEGDRPPVREKPTNKLISPAKASNKSTSLPKNTDIPPLYAQDLDDLDDISYNEGASSNTNSLPKTGLDFLDNW